MITRVDGKPNEVHVDEDGFTVVNGIRTGIDPLLDAIAYLGPFPGPRGRIRFFPVAGATQGEP